MITLEEARPHDALRLLALREEATRWMQQWGVQQWAPGEVSLGDVRAQVRGRQWFVLHQAETVVSLRPVVTTTGQSDPRMGGSVTGAAESAFSPWCSGRDPGGYVLWLPR